MIVLSAIVYGLVAIVCFGAATYILFTLVRDTIAMIKAPKGRKIEAYYTSAKGYNPFTGEPGRKLK